MAFEPKTWACGDTITAQELNRMEQGIEDASGGTETLMVEITAHAENCGDDYAITADKTYNDIL